MRSTDSRGIMVRLCISLSGIQGFLANAWASYISSRIARYVRYSGAVRSRSLHVGERRNVGYTSILYIAISGYKLVHKLQMGE